MRGWDSCEDSAAKSFSEGQHDSPYRQRHLTSLFFDRASASVMKGKKPRKAWGLILGKEFCCWLWKYFEVIYQAKIGLFIVH
jgi:hypothetical protein